MYIRLTASYKPCYHHLHVLPQPSLSVKRCYESVITEGDNEDFPTPTIRERQIRHAERIRGKTLIELMIKTLRRTMRHTGINSRGFCFLSSEVLEEREVAPANLGCKIGRCEEGRLDERNRESWGDPLRSRTVLSRWLG